MNKEIAIEEKSIVSTKNLVEEIETVVTLRVTQDGGYCEGFLCFGSAVQWFLRSLLVPASVI